MLFLLICLIVYLVGCALTGISDSMKK